MVDPLTIVGRIASAASRAVLLSVDAGTAMRSNMIRSRALVGKRTAHGHPAIDDNALPRHI